MCLGCCWKDLDEQDLMDLFCKIWIQKVGDIDFLSNFCHWKIQINSTKTRFWKEKSVVTLEGLAFN
jgi:hypothetical protein